MGIFFDESRKLRTLDTADTSYQLRVDAHGFLRHLYYGASVGRSDMSYLYNDYDRGFSGNPYLPRYDRTLSLDTLPQEYTSFGVGDFRVGAISVVNGDGSYSADFRYVSHEILPGKYAIPGMPAVYDNGGEAETLIITVQDPVTLLTVRLYYGVFAGKNIITRAAEIINEGRQTAVLEKAASACLDVPFGSWDLIHFHGRHCMERQMERRPLLQTIQTVASTRGMSSHHHNPFVILCDHAANEDHGDCYGLMLMYSGSHKTEIEVDQFGSVRAVTGIHDAQFRWPLAPGERFFTPEVILTYSAGGLTALSHRYHDVIRRNVCRGMYKLARRPVLINNWEATYYDFDEEKLLSLARQAAELGIELFVLDDGWFGNRNDDNAGLGDWTANPEKLPHGLHALAEKINALGLRFGLWIEPEMVSEDSDLYRTHPDWAFSSPGRRPMKGRNQLVLDLSRADVREHIYAAISKLLRENNIAYIKWDMNRALSDIYSRALPPDRQGEASHRYVLGVYALLERLTAEFPHILFEGCAGGGGRFDAAMLYYTPQIWCSDDTDAMLRVKIHYGTSFGYPACVVGAHVSASPNHQTGRTTPLYTRSIVAMSGSFGYELDPGRLTAEERAAIQLQISDFKRYSPLILDGLYYRLSDPDAGQCYHAWQFVSQDKRESLVSLVVHSPQANSPLIHVRLKGLNPDMFYLIEGENRVCSGKALMRGGYSFPLLFGDYPAMQLHLKQTQAP